MSLVAPIAIAKLGTVFRPWDAAPAGALLAFGGECRRGMDRQWEDIQRQLIVVRADGESDVKVMVSVLPDVSLIMPAPQSGEFRSFESTFAFPQPAIDISADYDLVASDLAPQDQGADFELGDVVHAPSGEIFAFVGKTRQERFISLSGSKQWKICGRPDGHLVILGKLSATLKAR